MKVLLFKKKKKKDDGEKKTQPKKFKFFLFLKDFFKWGTYAELVMEIV